MVDECLKCNGRGIVTDPAIRYKLGKPTDNIVNYLKEISKGRKECTCRRVFRRAMSLIEANIPEDLWTINHRSRHVEDVMVEDVGIHKRVSMLRLVNRYVNKLGEARGKGIGFVFQGPNGVGKTLFGCKILVKAIRKGYSVHYIFFNNLMEMLKQFDDEFVHDVIAEIYDVDFLFIDELGKEIKTSKFVLTKFEELLKQRRARQKPIIFAMNLSLEEFEKTYDFLAVSLIESKNLVLSFEKLGDFRVDHGRPSVREFFRR